MLTTPDQSQDEEQRYESRLTLSLCQRSAYSVSTRSINDLTQYIHKTSVHATAHGGFGDIWKCILVLPSEANEFKEVRRRDLQ